MPEQLPPVFLRGSWIRPGDDEYERYCTGWNLVHRGRPRVIASCRGAADVRAALGYARAHQLPVTVRSTGYGVAGTSVGDGLVIDLSPMRGVTVDPVRRVAHVQGGATGGDVQVEAAEFGLAGVTGHRAGTGMGTILGGGLGWLRAQAGLASDNILSAEVVTADGRILTASPTQNDDLFWALRGTGGAFGVVTSAELRLHEIPDQVHAGVLGYRGDKIADVLRVVRDTGSWAPDALSLQAILTIGLAPPFADQLILELMLCYVGDQAAGERALAPVRAAAHADVDSVAPATFLDLHFRGGDELRPMRFVSDPVGVDALTDALIDALVDSVRGMTGRGLSGAPFVEIVPMSGALGRAGDDAGAAHGHGTTEVAVGAAAFWEAEADDAAFLAWSARAHQIVERSGASTGHALPVAVSLPVSAERAAAMYGGAIDRIRELKRKWDPDGVFDVHIDFG